MKNLKSEGSGATFTSLRDFGGDLEGGVKGFCGAELKSVVLSVRCDGIWCKCLFEWGFKGFLIKLDRSQNLDRESK